MIKFFRKIRQRLLSENKLSKYFLYAIGEIVLVVMGILIALQINNNNELNLNNNFGKISFPLAEVNYENQNQQKSELENPTTILKPQNTLEANLLTRF